MTPMTQIDSLLAPAAARMRACAAALIALGALGSAGAAAAPDEPDVSLSELPLDALMEIPVETIYGASKFEQKVTKAPASISIVTADEIRAFGYRTLADVLRSVRGVYVTYDRNYSNFGMRGFNRPGDFNTRVLLLVDGHRMNDNLYSSALIGPEAMLDVDLIERVEIVRGPSSSIYGSNAFFGVINVVTRGGGQIDGVEAAASGGSFDAYHGRLSYGRALANGTEMALSGSVSDKDGPSRLYYREFDTPESNHGIAEDADGERARSAYGSLAYGDVTLSGGYSRRDKQIPTASFGTHFNDGREASTDERIYADLRYAREIGAATSLTGRLAYDRYAYRADYPYNWAGPGEDPFVVVSHDETYGDSAGFEAYVTHRLGRATLVTGGEYRNDLNLSQESFFGSPRTYTARDHRSSHSTGLFFQGEMALAENLLANAGLRYDSYQQFGDALSPRLGLIYTPWQRTNVKLLVGEAYRAPNAYEFYQESSGFSRANPNLDPETIRTVELAVEHYFPRNVRLGVSAYHYDIDDLISQQQDSDGLLVFRNVHTVAADGIELELEGRFGPGLTARGSYALQHAEDRDSGETLNNSPRHLAKLNLSMPLPFARIGAGLDLQHTSSLKTRDDATTSDATVANLTLSRRRVLGALDLSASVYNLFDTRYAHPGSTGHFQDTIPQDGRTLLIKAVYGF